MKQHTKDQFTAFQIMEQLGKMFQEFRLTQTRKPAPVPATTATPAPARKRQPESEDREYRHKRHSENRRDR